MSQFIEMTGDPRTNPKGWTVKKLPELASYSIGLTYKPEQVSESGTIVLRSGNIQSYKIDLTDVVRVDCPIKESIYVQKDDILMCSRNGSAALVGKVAQIKEIHEPMTYGAFMTVIRSEYSDFLYLYFQSKDFREQVSTGKSSTMNQITQNMLDKISIPLPDGDTRKKLSDILHQADKSKFGDFKSQFIEMYYNTHNKQTLESVCPIMSKGITPKYVESSSVLVINQACIHWDGQRLGNIKYHNEEIPVRKRILESGDVLLNATGNGTLGRCCVFICPSDNNIYINDGHVIALSTDRAVILPEVLNTYLSLNDTQAEIYRQYVTGSTNQVDIVFSDIKKMKVPVPSMDEQILFVEVLTQADKSKSVIQKALVYLNDIQSDELGKIA